MYKPILCSGKAATGAIDVRWDDHAGWMPVPWLLKRDKPWHYQGTSSAESAVGSPGKRRSIYLRSLYTTSRLPSSLNFNACLQDFNWRCCICAFVIFANFRKKNYIKIYLGSLLRKPSDPKFQQWVTSPTR